MKFKFVPFVLLMALFLTACAKEESENHNEPVESNIHLIQTHVHQAHQILLYADSEDLKAGYNRIYLQVKDQASGQVLTPEAFEFLPVMHMMSKMHSCPHSPLNYLSENEWYSGYAIFQMPGNASEYWELQLSYTIEGTQYSLDMSIQVNGEEHNHRSVSVFEANDGSRYVLSLLPFDPRVAVNPVSAMLFRMEDMMTFKPVSDYSIQIDPRMPGMGNHSSPNNVHFAYRQDSEIYQGELSLTMTGYWVINLKLLNDKGAVVKGEDILGSVTRSSIFFELEF